MKTFAVVLVLAALLLAHQALSRPASNSKLAVSEVSLGKLQSDTVKYSLVFSADGQHIAYVVRRNGKKLAVVDGREGKAYDDIPEVPLSEAGRPDEIHFSPDGNHVAYVAREGTSSFLVLDGAPGKSYERIAVGGFYFSPDSKHVTYVAERGGRSIVVVDSVESGPYEFIETTPLKFTSDSRHIFYVARRGNNDVLVRDNNELRVADQIGSFTISPDGKRIAYAFRAGEEWRVVVDDKVDKPYRSIGNSIVFSEDSKHSLYRGSNERNDVIVVDGVEQKHHGIIPEATYSFTPDNRPVYVYELRRGIVSWVVGDVESKSYDDVWKSIWLSADGKHNAFVASDGKKLFVVNDRIEGPGFDDIRSFIFSPNGARWMYVGLLAGKVSLVLDGVVTEYEDVYDGGFSPDSKRLALNIKKNGKSVIIVDGVETKPNDAQFGRLLFSEDSQRLAYVAGTGKGVFFVVDGKEGRSYDEVRDLKFINASRSFFYQAKRGERLLVVVDENESPEYDEFISFPEFDGAGSIRFIAQRRNEYFRVALKLS